ncbi:hypothetical protein E2C01_051519 [Portunus trituberculatus]|uniref:Uncharacterized protein n=1 Tax=Portunus trituberculatus TaxID=210409 RepID=A0A5B7GKJ6_PORTR|nr:hypothetical protein [Portunus trituberculatus]
MKLFVPLLHLLSRQCEKTIGGSRHAALHKLGEVSSTGHPQLSDEAVRAGLCTRAMINIPAVLCAEIMTGSGSVVAALLSLLMPRMGAAAMLVAADAPAGFLFELKPNAIRRGTQRPLVWPRIALTKQIK